MVDFVLRVGTLGNDKLSISRQGGSKRFIVKLLAGDDTATVSTDSSVFDGGPGRDEIRIASGSRNQIYGFETVILDGRSYGNQIFGNNGSIHLYDNASAAVSGQKNKIYAWKTNNITINGHSNIYRYDRSKFDPSKENFHGITINGDKNSIIDASKTQTQEDLNITVNGSDNYIESTRGLVQLGGTRNTISGFVNEIYNYCDSLTISGTANRITKMGKPASGKRNLITFAKDTVTSLTLDFSNPAPNGTAFDFDFGIKNNKKLHELRIVGAFFWQYVDTTPKSIDVYGSGLRLLGTIKNWSENDKLFINDYPEFLN